MIKSYSVIWIDHNLVHPFISWWTISCFYFVAIISNAFMTICIQIFMWTCVFIFLGVDLEVWFLGLTVILCLTFWATARMLFEVATLFYLLTSSVWGFQRLQVFANTCYCPSFGWQPSFWVWDFLVVLICIPLLANDGEHLLMCLLAIYMSSVEKCLFRSSACFGGKDN